MKIIISPNSFKGTLSSIDACNLIERGIKKVNSRFNTYKLPIADGGDGSLDFFKYYFPYKSILLKSLNPVGETIQSEYILIEKEKTAVIEFANSSGYSLMINKERDLSNMDSYGTGIQIKSAIDNGAKKIILCLGGSATIDGASGILKALGVKFLKDGKEVEKRNPITEMEEVDISNFLKYITNVEFILLSDVNNRILGKDGAVMIYGKQKGLYQEYFTKFENYLEKFTQLASKIFDINLLTIEGGGSAGGAGAILSAFFNAKLYNGTEFLLEFVNYKKYMNDSSVLITGEGAIDLQSLNNKGPIALIQYINNLKIKKPITIAIAGKFDYSLNGKFNNIFDYIFSISDMRKTEDVIKDSKKYLQEESIKVGRFINHLDV
ncbi:MAG: glycerate kinase [Cytophagales bacterium]